MAWEDSIQGWIGKGLDIYNNQRIQDAQNEYEVERLRLLQRNQFGQPYYEGQAGVPGALGAGMSTGTKTALMLGGGLLLVLLVVKA